MHVIDIRRLLLRLQVRFCDDFVEPEMALDPHPSIKRLELYR